MTLTQLNNDLPVFYNDLTVHQLYNDLSLAIQWPYTGSIESFLQWPYSTSAKQWPYAPALKWPWYTMTLISLSTPSGSHPWDESTGNARGFIPRLSRDYECCPWHCRSSRHLQSFFGIFRLRLVSERSGFSAGAHRKCTLISESHSNHVVQKILDINTPMNQSPKSEPHWPANYSSNNDCGLFAIL